MTRRLFTRLRRVPRLRTGGIADRGHEMTGEGGYSGPVVLPGGVTVHWADDRNPPPPAPAADWWTGVDPSLWPARWYADACAVQLARRTLDVDGPTARTVIDRLTAGEHLDDIIADLSAGERMPDPRCPDCEWIPTPTYGGPLDEVTLGRPCDVHMPDESREWWAERDRLARLLEPTDPGN